MDIYIRGISVLCFFMLTMITIPRAEYHMKSVCGRKYSPIPRQFLYLGLMWHTWRWITELPLGTTEVYPLGTAVCQIEIYTRHAWRDGRSIVVFFIKHKNTQNSNYFDTVEPCLRIYWMPYDFMSAPLGFIANTHVCISSHEYFPNSSSVCPGKP